MSRYISFFIFLVFCIIVLNSCGSNKVLLNKPIEKALSTEENTSYKLTVTPNRLLLINTDQFNINNVTQVEGQNLVLKFEYKTNPPKNLADANYREVLFIEIPNEIQKIDLTNIDKATIWFARFCFCKEFVGFYRVIPNQFELVLGNHQLSLKSEIEFHNLPRVLHVINQNISLKP